MSVNVRVYDAQNAFLLYIILAQEGQKYTKITFLSQIMPPIGLKFCQQMHLGNIELFYQFWKNSLKFCEFSAKFGYILRVFDQYWLKSVNKMAFRTSENQTK